VARAVLACGGLELPDDLELLVAGEDDLLGFLFLAADDVFLGDEVNEAAEDVEEGIALEDFLPEVRGGEAAGVVGVAGAAVTAGAAVDAGWLGVAY